MYVRCLRALVNNNMFGIIGGGLLIKEGEISAARGALRRGLHRAAAGRAALLKHNV